MVFFVRKKQAKHSVAVDAVVFGQLKNLYGKALITEEQFLSDRARGQFAYVGHSEEGVEPDPDAIERNKINAHKLLTKVNLYHQIYIRRFDLAKELELTGGLSN